MYMTIKQNGLLKVKRGGVKTRAGETMTTSQMFDVW